MSEPVRILQLNSARKYIGEAAHTLNLTEALRQRGHLVLLGLRKGYETMERAAERKLEPIGFNMPHRWWPPQDGRDIKQIARLVREHKIQLIHAHRGKDHWQAVFANKLYRLKVPVVRTRHVVTPLSDNFANRWLAKRTAALIAVSKAVETDVARARIYAKDHLHFIPGGVDLDLFKPPTAEQRAAARAKLKLPPDVPVAVCVARFAVVKAHGVLLHAWQTVLREIPNAKLVLIGAGQLQAQNEILAKSLHIDGSVIFAGKRNDVPELLAAADVGVLSSVGSEGFSRAVLEYMAAGLPTVATRVGAVPDLVVDGVTGEIVAPNDAPALAEGLYEALHAPAEKRAAWGRAAREKAEHGYSYATWAGVHERLYWKLLHHQ